MIDEFNYFSEYAAAAYCINGALDPGRTLYCMRDGVNLCPTLSSNNAVSFRYMKYVFHTAARLPQRVATALTEDPSPEA